MGHITKTGTEMQGKIMDHGEKEERVVTSMVKDMGNKERAKAEGKAAPLRSKTHGTDADNAKLNIGTARYV